MNKQRQVSEAWRQWIELDEWNVHATLNFGRLSLLRGNKTDAASKLWRSCLSTLDRAIYGQARRSKPRFNRIAFRHSGANGTNPHVHLLVRAPLPVHEFCIAWNAMWASKFEPAANPMSNSIAPLISAHGAIDYGLHEEFKLDMGSFDGRLSYINSGIEHLVRADAFERLHKQATQASILKARLALPDHIRISQKNFDRRERARAAALLRS